MKIAVYASGSCLFVFSVKSINPTKQLPVLSAEWRLDTTRDRYLWTQLLYERDRFKLLVVLSTVHLISGPCVLLSSKRETSLRMSILRLRTSCFLYSSSQAHHQDSRVRFKDYSALATGHKVVQNGQRKWF